jgi:hypothetical protein
MALLKCPSRQSNPIRKLDVRSDRGLPNELVSVFGT